MTQQTPGSLTAETLPATFVSVHPGRSLTTSPEWHADEPSVLFDRNSGDYWVIAPTARKWVELLQNADQPLDTSVLISAEPCETKAEAEVALKQLIELDIFVGTTLK